MAKAPNSGSFKARDPAQMKQEPAHKLTQRPKKKTLRPFGNPLPIQQMHYKG